MSVQHFKVFFGPDDPWGAAAPTADERRELVAAGFAGFIGNERAIKKLKASAFDALGKPDHLCRDLAFAIFGPASSGKTTLARLYAKTVDLPFVEVSPKAVKTMDDLFREIDRVLTVEGVPVVEVVRRNYHVLPPCVIFIDEVHALAKAVEQGLLKATEFNDATLVTESGKTINCHNVCWIIATTDEGRLFDAFRTRFSPVNLKYLSKADIAKIVRLAHPDFDDETAALVAHYNSRIPRKALEFARYMKLVRQMGADRTWVDVAQEVATDEGIDQFGMHETHLRILKALGQGPVAANRIVNVAGAKKEEVERYIMPWLLTVTDDTPALVTVTSRGYTITDAGLAELDKRGIAHRGTFATPNYRP
jgi:Holliday junction resolvasome RuvABC ATP-dependent DNA helicase subunit